MCNGNRRCCLSYNLQNAKLIINFLNNIFLNIFMYIYFLVPSSQLEIFFEFLFSQKFKDGTSFDKFPGNHVRIKLEVCLFRVRRNLSSCKELDCITYKSVFTNEMLHTFHFLLEQSIKLFFLPACQ